MRPRHRRLWLQTAALLAAATPLATLLVRFLADDLGANPIEEITHATGDWTLRLLLLCLAVTPARKLLGWSALAPLRRTLGLAAFAYACLHLLCYVWLDQYFAWKPLLEDVLKRRYISAGFASFLCLLPLALTSTRRMQRRLGRRWSALHRLVYVAAIGGVIHYLWLSKADLRAPFVYAGVLGALFASRLWLSRGRRVRVAPGGAGIA